MDDVDELVPGAHRAVRRLDDTESPYPGALVADGDRQRVRVDAASVDTALWEFADAEHVVGVRDVLREPHGHGALLPWCIEPVDVFLGRRTAAERPLAAGEAVTLVGSLLRGVAEVGDRAVPGRWWLDDRCRPLFAPGEGTTCAEASLALMELVRRECSDRAMERVLSRICAEARDHRIVLRALDGWESELTELAAPRPLDSEVHAPERVRAIPLHRAHVSAGAAMEGRVPLGERLTRGGRVAVERVRGAAERRRSARRSLRPGSSRATRPGAVRDPRGGTSTRVPRMRMLIVGGAAAGAVLLGGLLLPGGDAPETAAGAEGTPPAVHPQSEEQSEAAAEPAPRDESPEESSPEQSDVQRAVRRLLTLIDSCRAESDGACERAVIAGGGQAVLDRVGPDAARRDAVLVDDYGDVAVIRLAAVQEQPEQMLVLERDENGWLIRDAYDVADQPPAGS